jgi:hypothetical protein
MVCCIPDIGHWCLVHPARQAHLAHQDRHHLPKYQEHLPKMAPLRPQARVSVRGAAQSEVLDGSPVWVRSLFR